MRKIISLLTVLTLTPTIATTVNACEKNQSSLFDFFNALKGQKFNSSIKVESDVKYFKKILIIKAEVFFNEYLWSHSSGAIALEESLYQKIDDALNNGQLWNLGTNTIVNDLNDLKPILEKPGNLNLKYVFFIPGISQISYTCHFKIENKDNNQLKNIIDYSNYQLLMMSLKLQEFKNIYHGMKLQDFNSIFENHISYFLKDVVLPSFIELSYLTDFVFKNNGHAISDADLKNPGTLSLTFSYKCTLDEEDSFTGESKIPIKWNLI